MLEIALRFVIGGIFVSLFALSGDIVRPKSFAGIFAAAPSVALATLALTISRDGPAFAAQEGRAMIAGAVAFMAYAYCAKILMMICGKSALSASTMLILLWLGCAALLWLVWLR
jgi:hypothetical protein